MKSNKRLLVSGKRVLAWLLAVAMVTGTLPTSVAHAAELPAAETEGVVSSGDVSTNGVSENEVIDDVTAKVAAADEATEGGAAKEVYADGDTTTTATSKAVVTWDAAELATYVELAGFDYDYVATQAEAYYKAKLDNDYGNLETYANFAVTVKAGGKEVEVTPTYAWKKDGGAVLETGKKPTDVGKYQLVATVDATGTTTASDPTTVLTLEIKKAPVEISLTGKPNWTFRAGITVAEVKTYVKENLQFSVNKTPTKQGDIASGEVGISVKEAYTAALQSDDVVLQKNQDYCVDIAVSLKDNASYELVETRFNLILEKQTKTKIEVTYADAKDARAKGKVYDGAELAYTTADGAFDSAKAGFTYKVLYDKDHDANEVCEEVLTNATVTGTWLDADKNVLGGNPVHAGVYYYLLTYSDENDTYAFAYQYIRVEIETAKIMVVPNNFPTDYKVYDGMKVSDILKDVDYTMYKVPATGGRGDMLKDSEGKDIDKKRFWGFFDQSVEAPGASEKDYNQYYEPLFEMQRGTTENGVVKWVPIDDDDTILWHKVEQKEIVNENTSETTTTTVTTNYSYRIVFTGEKGVYDADGSVQNKKGINESQGDYTVSTSLAVREADGNVCSLSESTATKVTIKVDDICENGAGKEYTNPIERTYAGSSAAIYKTRDDYKKATVEGGDVLNLNYTWYELQPTSIALDKDGNIKDGDLKWMLGSDYGSWENDVEWICSPYRAGVYRLEVSYQDSTCATYADPVSLYYVIHPQSAKVEIEGSVEIYDDHIHTAEDLLLSLQNVDDKDKATYVTLKGYRVNATGKDAVTPVELQEGEVDPVQALVEYYFNINNRYYDDYYNKFVPYRLDYFCVERLKKDTEENPGTWVKVDNSTVLSKDETYRVSFDRDYYNYCYKCSKSDYQVDGKTVYYTICRNREYNFGLQLDKCNRVLDEEYYKNSSATLTVKNSNAAEITIDTSAFEGFEKVYDGKPLSLDALKNSIKVTTVVDGKETDISTEVKPLLKYVIHDNVEEGFVVDRVDANHAPVNAVHAGTYEVDIVFETNEKYCQTSTTVENFVIKQKKVAVTFELKESIKAGVRLDNDQAFADEILNSDNVENVCKFELEGDSVKLDAVMDGETMLREAVDESDVAKIVGKPHSWWISESKDNKSYTGYLKSSKTYYVKVTGFEYGTYVDSVYGTMSYDRDYVAVSEEKSFSPDRAAAKVEKADNLGTALNDYVTKSESGVFQHEITAREDVPFDYDEYKDHAGVKQGQGSNIFRFKLNAPYEFFGEKSFNRNSYVFENAIKNIEKVGGYVESIDTKGNYIVVAFDLALNKSVEFDVIFDINLDEKNEIYTEKYVIDLSKMVAEADMEKAVAPKSLAFNGAPKKLAVGEEVQLDVTVKKNQMSDIIFLGYESDHPEILQVSDTGYLTAVAKGSATITVSSCKRVNGKVVKLGKDEKGVAKTLKITVTDVAKPKLSKVTGRDDMAFITYTIPANGYRRELYVMEGKKKEKDFEEAIADVVNGDYSAFTYVDLSLADKENNSFYCDSKKVVNNVEIYGLTPELKDGYTVYLRNVSGLHTMADGTEVATSFAGAAKNFKTTKSEAQAIDVYFKLSDQIKRVYWDYEYYDEEEDEDTNSYYYKVNFADKSSKVTVEAMFWERYSKNYSDNRDYIWRPLPLGAEKGYYNNPKMKFFVSDWAKVYDDRVDTWIDTSVMTKVDDHKWIDKTPLAKIDNSGKITYLGKGFVRVLAYDMVSKNYDWLTIKINANPNSMSAKAIKLQPGQSVMLSSCLEYKEGKAKVVNYPYYCDLVTETASNDWFKIEYVEDEYDPYDEQGGDYRITALKAGGTINIAVKDRVVTANGGSGTTLKITSPAVEAVKSAKVSAAYDDRFRVTFAYPTGNMNFRFELKNASGKVITDTIQDCTGKWDSKTKKYIYTVNFGNPSDWSGWDEWHTTGNNDVSAMVNKRNRITLLSNYTVGITAVYANEKYCNVNKAEAEKTQMSKTVTVKVKTTNVPASYWDVDAYNLAINRPVKSDGGVVSRVMTKYDGEGSWYAESTNVLFKAGNTYDFEIYLDATDKRCNRAAQKRMSDSLTWKSSNSKVASIKANPGTFTAKLVAVKQGTTTIEVTSKLTKKVIARQTITIGAVGDAKNYFGENTPYKNGDEVPVKPYGWSEILDDTDLQKNATKLTLNNDRKVTLKAGQIQCFVFEVPAYGKYNCSVSGNTSNYIVTGKNDDNMYEKGEKLYIYVANRTLTSVTRTVSVTGNAYTEITMGDNTVLNGGNYVFRAPMDNWYTFTYVNPADTTGTTYELWNGGLSANGIKMYTLNRGDVEIGKEVTLRVTAREVAGSLTTAEAGNPIKLRNAQTVWYQFDATEANRYTFTFEAKDGKDVSVSYVTSLKDNSSNISSPWPRAMDANEKLYLAVKSNDATAEAPVEVTIKITKREMVGTAPAAGATEASATEASVEFTKAEAKYYAFTAPTDGFYKFIATPSENQYATLEVYESLKDENRKAGNNSGSPASVVYYLNATQTIYLGVKTEVSTVSTENKVTVKLKTVAVTAQIIGEDTQTFGFGEGENQVTVYWRVPTAGNYSIQVTGADESTVVSGTVDNSSYNMNNRYCSANTTHEIKLTRTSGTGSAKVTITKK